MSEKWREWMAPFTSLRSIRVNFVKWIQSLRWLNEINWNSSLLSLRGLFFTRIKFHLIAVNSWRLASRSIIQFVQFHLNSVKWTEWIHSLAVSQSLLSGTYIPFTFIWFPLIALSFHWVAFRSHWLLHSPYGSLYRSLLRRSLHSITLQFIQTPNEWMRGLISSHSIN